jgi:hypothetical protein
MLSQQPIELRLNTCLYTSSIPIFPQSINRKTKKKIVQFQGVLIICYYQLQFIFSPTMSCFIIYKLIINYQLLTKSITNLLRFC